MKLLKIILSFFIAPHGMTDLIHGIEMKSLPKLAATHSVGLATSLYMPKKMLVPTLLTTTAVHFRHDINIPPPNNMIVSTALALSSGLLGINVMAAYLAVIHVPRHYRDMHEILISNPKLTSIVMTLSTLLMGLSSAFLPNIIDLNNDSVYLRLLIGVINSHIIYEELVIRINQSSKQIKAIKGK